MKILITGGAGLIGYYVSLSLSEMGHDVMAYDNFSSFVDPAISNYHFYMNERLKNLKGRAQIVRGDVRDWLQVTNAYHKFQPRVVIHLAAVADARVFDTRLEEASETNVQGTFNCLEAIRTVPSVKRFVFASSSFVYGDFQSPCVDEGHPTLPKDAYGRTKLAGERMARTFCAWRGIEYAIVRPSSVYGPTDSNRRVTQIFIENALQGRELILEGGARNRLDFTYVKDIAQGFALAALEEGAANRVFNVTYGKSRTLQEYVQILSRQLPGIRTVERPADSRRPSRGTLDISLARRWLGYQPRYCLEDGLREYAAYVMDRLHNLNLCVNGRQDPAFGRPDRRCRVQRGA